MKYKNEKGISIFFPYRSFHNQDFNSKVLWFLVLPFVANLILLFSLNEMTYLWGQVIQYFLTNTGNPGSVGYITYTVLHYNLNIPYINLASRPPSYTTCLMAPIWIALLFILSILIPDSFTPLKYFFRVFLLVMLTSVIYFLIFPTQFPYNIPAYTGMGLLQIIALMFITPWIYVFTYYVLGYRFMRKIIITFILLLYFAIFAPFQYLLNALIVHEFSLLYMPALYLFLGLLTDICIIIAIYAYGVSKEQMLKKYKAL